MISATANMPMIIEIVRHDQDYTLTCEIGQETKKKRETPKTGATRQKYIT